MCKGEASPLPVFSALAEARGLPSSCKALAIIGSAEFLCVGWIAESTLLGLAPKPPEILQRQRRSGDVWRPQCRHVVTEQGLLEGIAKVVP